MPYNKLLIIALFFLIAAGCDKKTTVTSDAPPVNNQSTREAETKPSTQTVEFSKFNPTYRFSAEIQSSWKIEYVTGIESINIYDPARPGNNPREQSLIFIRYFNANNFLTLSTVDILNRAETEVKGHAAVKYEIKKKNGVANFPQQPAWRNQQHKLIDIRYTKSNPSPFYVFAYNPELPQVTFDAFIESLIFHNDASSLKPPVLNFRERVTKKPFGTLVSPTNSPVSPERFSGYHNAVDFEILAGEENQNVSVNAICGGIMEKKQKSSGYGGVATQTCLIKDELVTVIYGHVQLGSIHNKPGDYLAPGDFLAFLGAGESSDTDGARKHLHLGIHKGTNSDIRGYVPSQSELNNWLDIMALLPS